MTPGAADAAELRDVPATPDDAAILGALPPVAREMVDALGLAPALELLQTLRGRRVLIPPQLADDSSLVAQVGRETAEKLVLSLGLGVTRTVDLPLLVGVDRMLRNTAIRAGLAAGESQAELARRYRLTERHIRKIASPGSARAGHTPTKRLPRDPATLRLFCGLVGFIEVAHRGDRDAVAGQLGDQ